jgi:hypothetical protein
VISIIEAIPSDKLNWSETIVFEDDVHARRNDARLTAEDSAATGRGGVS